MYSFSVTLRLIFATSLLVSTVHSDYVLNLPKRRIDPIPYERLPSIDVAPQFLQLRDENGSFLCAGTLIGPQYVITAAECFDRLDYTKVIVVARATTVTDEGIERNIVKINKHPLKHINVAVIKLNEPLMDIQPMELGSYTLADHLVSPNIKLLGWRHLARRKSVTKELYMVRAEVTPQGECELAFYAAGTKRIFCLHGLRYAGQEEDPCVSDIGGPAILTNKLVGIVSKGHKCGYSDYVTAVTSLTDIFPFINDAMT